MNPSPYPASYPAPFNSAHIRANIVKILLAVGAIVSVILLVSETLSLVVSPLREDEDISANPLGLAVTLITFLVAVLSVLVYLATVIFFCVWLYRAHSNLTAFGTPRNGFEYSSGLAVGSFFIPFANLIIPYRAVREVWQKSIPLDEALLSAPGTPTTFPIWWTFWLLSSFAGNLSFRLSFNEKVDEGTATIVSIVASALSIIAALMAYLVVDQIDKRQEETTQKLGLGKFSRPPVPTDLAMANTAMPQ